MISARLTFRRPDRSFILILFGVFFSILASKLFLIAQFGSGIPFWDQWDGEARDVLVPFLEGRLRLADLVSPHNEHRIALTRLLVLGLFSLNGQWDPLVSMVVQAALHAGILAFFVASVRCSMGLEYWGLFATLTALFYAVPFSWNNTLWGFQSQFYFVLLAGLAGIWLTWRSKELSTGWWLGWLMLLMGLFAMGSGILAPVAAFAVGAVRVFTSPAPRWRGWTGLAAISVVVLLAVRLLVNHPGHEHLKAQSISNFLGFFLQLIAWPTANPLFGVLLHLPVLVMGMFVLMHRPTRRNPAWFLAALGAWSVLSAAALAYGRANSGLDSRYTDGLAFGLLTSLACAFHLASIATAKWRRMVQATAVLGVAIATGGILHLFSSDLLDRISERKALDPIQESHLQAFLATNDLQALENKPHLHIPYPSAMILAQALRQKSLKEVLPAAIHPGVSPSRAIFSENAFVENGGVYPTTTPKNPKLHFGSYTRTGDISAGELRLEYTKPHTASHFSLAIAGYPLADGMELFIETEDGAKTPIHLAADPREEWTTAYFENPGEPFSIVAVDASPSKWLALGLPTSLGWLSVLAIWAMDYWWTFGAVGLACFVAGCLLTPPRHLQAT